MLAACVMPACQMELDRRIKSKKSKLLLFVLIYAFTAFMVIGRLISGVHWVSDIIGGALVSTGLVLAYRAVTKMVEKKD
jgi:undecaprenyl-diphosphatase